MSESKGHKAHSEASTKSLKRVLGRKELLAMAVGQIIGAGIFSMVGLGIGWTGKSIWLAFLIAAFFIIVAAIPSIIIGGTVRLRGGEYTQFALMVGEKFTGFYIIVFIMTNVCISVYAIAFAQYIMSIVPGLNEKYVALLVLGLFYVLNLFGVKGAARLQNIMVLVMSAALAVLIAYGLPNVQPGSFDFSSPEFMTNGLKAFLTTSAVMSFAIYGGISIMNYSAECKNPTRDLPFAIIGATLFVAVVYVLISIVASGVLPISEVAFKPLTLVADAVLPKALYLFFILGGAMIALSTTLNAALGWVTKPVLQACVDGWFPRGFGALTEKGKVPYKILTVFVVINAVIIISGWDISGIASSSLVLLFTLMIIRTVRLYKFDQIIPEAWEKSKFRLSKNGLILVEFFSILVMLVQIYFMVIEWSMNEWVYNSAVLVVGLVFTFTRYASGKTNVEISYEIDEQKDITNKETGQLSNQS